MVVVFNVFFWPLQGVLHFQVETEGLSWSYIFGQLERNRAALNIVDYSVSQTTLEQVNTEYCFSLIKLDIVLSEAFNPRQDKLGLRIRVKLWLPVRNVHLAVVRSSYNVFFPQVFINFAKEQHSEERTSVKKQCGCFPC